MDWFLNMDQKNKYFLALLGVLACCLLQARTSLAHGVQASYSRQMGIEIQAGYDTGEPMSQAQVAVFAPDEPGSAWLTGKCDDQGRFRFVPDPAQGGIWNVRIRQAGHGTMLHIPMEQDQGQKNIQESAAKGFTALQLFVIIACVLWGSLGTAFYFWSRQGD